MTLIIRDAVNTPTENKTLLKLMKGAPMQGIVQLGLEREPNFFESMDLSGSKVVVKVVVDDENDQIVGCMAFSYRDLYVNGEAKEVIFTSDIRVEQSYRGKGVFKKLAEAFTEEVQDGWTQGIVLKGNVKAEKVMIEKMPAYMPQSYLFGEMDTNLVFSKRRAKLSSNARIRIAEEKDIPQMQALHDKEAPKYHFCAKYDFSQLLTNNPYYRGLNISDFLVAEENGEIIAFAGLWNQKANKQTRVHKYHWSLKSMRVAYNLVNKVIGRAQLPKEGGYLNYYYMNALTCPSDKVDVFKDIVAVATMKAYQAGMMGVSVSLSPQDERIKALDGMSKSGVSARHFLSGFCDDPTANLDDRTLAIEVCRL